MRQSDRKKFIRSAFLWYSLGCHQWTGDGDLLDTLPRAVDLLSTITDSWHHYQSLVGYCMPLLLMLLPLPLLCSSSLSRTDRHRSSLGVREASQSELVSHETSGEGPLCPSSPLSLRLSLLAFEEKRRDLLRLLPFGGEKDRQQQGAVTRMMSLRSIPHSTGRLKLPV